MRGEERAREMQLLAFLLQSYHGFKKKQLFCFRNYLTDFKHLEVQQKFITNKIVVCKSSLKSKKEQVWGYEISDLRQNNLFFNNTKENVQNLFKQIFITKGILILQ